MPDIAVPARRRVLAGLICALLAAGACGTDDQVQRSAPTSERPTTTTLSTEAVLDDLRASTGAPGALALVRIDGTEVFTTSGGADLGGAVLEETTTMRAGSITKTVFAALVLDAVARGELSLDDTVDQWIPGLLREPPVTVRMLLSHTSGIFNAGDEGDVVSDIAHIADPVLRQQAEDLGARYLAGEPVVVPDRIWVAMAETHERYGRPGTVYHYANAGYQVAGMVLSAATSRSVGELLAERLVNPLGLEHTTLAPDDMRPPAFRSYTLDASGAAKDTTGDLLAVGNGASGGLVTTAGELLTLLDAIVAGDLLPPGLREQMVTPTPTSDDTYGMGVVTFHLACGTFLGHAGAMAGTHALALLDEHGSDGLVIAINARTDEDPNLLATAEQLLCAGR